jgi:hypothetical protein
VKKVGAVEMFAEEEGIIRVRKSLPTKMTGFLVSRDIRATKLHYEILMMNMQFHEESFRIFFIRF